MPITTAIIALAARQQVLPCKQNLTVPLQETSQPGWLPHMCIQDPDMQAMGEGSDMQLWS